MKPFVDQVAKIYYSLLAAERPSVGILAGNFGEAGALSLYGPGHRLPRPMGRVNSFWLRGYDRREPEVVIITGLPAQFVNRHFQACEERGVIANSPGVPNEETRLHIYLWVCRGLREPWPVLWPKLRA